MKLSLRAWFFGSVLGCALVASAACATTDDAPPDPPLPASDAGLPPADGALFDAPVDPGPGPDADAALPECSPDGFCPTAVPADQTLRGVWGDGAGIVWAVSEQGAVLRWDGTAWKVHASQLGALSAIWGSGPTDLWIGGEKGLHHGVGASSASLVFTANAAPGAPLAITAIWGQAANEVWAVGGRPANRDVFPYGPPATRVLHYTGASTDGGAAWALDPLSARPVGLTQVWGSAASGVWFAGSRPIPTADFLDEILVFRKAPTASTFAEIALPRDPLESIPYDRLAQIVGGAVTADGTAWVLGRSNSNVPGYWRGTSSNGGATFSFTYEKGGRSDDPNLNALAANDTWAVGDYGRVRHGTAATGPWLQAAITRTKLPLTDPFYAVWSGGKQELWAVGRGVALHLDPSKKAGTP